MPVYLDHAATTPVFPDVAAAMSAQRDRVGNASSLHTAGRAARRVVEESRERLAGVLGARPSEVVFTSGGTESDNLAVAGVYRARRDADPRRRRLLVSAIEHHAVLDCVQALVDREGAEVDWLPCDADGVVQVADVRAAIADCAVYVLPSYREGTPRTVLEAMAMGRAIVTTDAPGCRETVVDGENGLLVPVRDVDALAAALTRFIDDPALAARMGAASRRRAVEKYDVHKVNAAMLEEMGIRS